MSNNGGILSNQLFSGLIGAIVGALIASSVSFGIYKINKSDQEEREKKEFAKNLIRQLNLYCLSSKKVVNACRTENIFYVRWESYMQNAHDPWRLDYENLINYIENNNFFVLKEDLELFDNIFRKLHNVDLISIYRARRESDDKNLSPKSLKTLHINGAKEKLETLESIKKSISEKVKI